MVAMSGDIVKTENQQKECFQPFEAETPASTGEQT
jgi:hypothetical protein